MRRRLTYANVAATLALVFSMSGGALAASHYLINSTKQINPKVLKKLKGARGASGVAGAPGLTGREGPQGKEGPPGKNAIIPALVWKPLTLGSQWAEFEFGAYGAPEFTKDPEGFVHLRGAIGGTDKAAEKEAVAELPEGYRPTTFVWLRAPATDGEAHPEIVDLEINSDGEVLVRNSATANDAFISLEGLTFYAG